MEKNKRALHQTKILVGKHSQTARKHGYNYICPVKYEPQDEGEEAGLGRGPGRSTCWGPCSRARVSRSCPSPAEPPKSLHTRASPFKEKHLGRTGPFPGEADRQGSGFPNALQRLRDMCPRPVFSAEEAAICALGTHAAAEAPGQGETRAEGDGRDLRGPSGEDPAETCSRQRFAETAADRSPAG